MATMLWEMKFAVRRVAGSKPSTPIACRYIVAADTSADAEEAVFARENITRANIVGSIRVDAIQSGVFRVR